MPLFLQIECGSLGAPTRLCLALTPRDCLGPEDECGKLARKFLEPSSWLQHSFGAFTYPEVQIVFDIPEQASHHCSKMDDVCGPNLFKQGLGLCSVPGRRRAIRGPLKA